MLCPYISWQHICPSDAIYISNMPITSCAHRRQLCQYIDLILTQCNQLCEQEHWYTYISHYWHMPLNTVYACHIVHICPTTLLLWSSYKPHITACTHQKPINHMPKLHHLHLWEKQPNYIYWFVQLAKSVKKMKRTIPKTEKKHGTIANTLGVPMS